MKLKKGELRVFYNYVDTLEVSPFEASYPGETDMGLMDADIEKVLKKYG